MRLSGISPFGPIFGKELRGASRRKRNYLLRVLYLGALLLFLLLAYSITRQSYGVRNASQVAQQQEQLGWIFFLFFSLFSVIAMGLIGPVLTCTAINGERLHKTLHVLLMTPLTAWQIVSGKLFSRLLTAMTLIGLSLPVLALVRLLGGVELQQMFGIVCLSIVTAMTSAALGLLLSVILRRAYAVILLSYMLMGVAYLFVPMMFMMLAAATGGGGRVVMRWMQFIASINPFWCAGFLASGQSRVMFVSWVPCVLVHLGATAIFLILTAVLLRYQTRREGEVAGGPAALPMLPPVQLPLNVPHSGLQLAGDESAAPVLSSSVLNFPSPPDRLPPPAFRPARTVSDNPVLWRELRRPLMNSRWQRIVGSVLCLALLFTVYAISGANDALGDNDSQIGFAFVFHTLTMLLACVISATAIAQEKEGDTWTVLLASPLSGRAIVWGKALGTARKMMWPMILVAAHFMLFVIAGVIIPPAWVMAMAVIIGFNSIWIATGIYLSLRCRRVTVAVIINLALPVLLYGVFSIVLVTIDEVSRTRGDLVDQVTWYLPYFYLAGLEKMDSQAKEIYMPAMGNERIGVRAFVSITVGVALLHIALAAAILWWTAARFDAIVGRAQQQEPLATRMRPYTAPGGNGRENGDELSHPLSSAASSDKSAT